MCIRFPGKFIVTIQIQIRMKKISVIPVLTVLVSLIVASCEKEDPVIPNEEELITTMIYTLLPPDGGPARVLKFEDPDGDGGEDPVFTVDDLDAGFTYTGSIVLLNEIDTPADTVSNEVWDEATQHQFFFTAAGGLDLSVAYSDADADGLPVGLSNILTTGDASSGTLKITLRHQPDKSGEGVSDGDVTNAGGETDIEVTFDVDIL